MREMKVEIHVQVEVRGKNEYQVKVALARVMSKIHLHVGEVKGVKSVEIKEIR